PERSSRTVLQHQLQVLAGDGQGTAPAVGVTPGEHCRQIVFESASSVFIERFEGLERGAVVVAEDVDEVSYGLVAEHVVLALGGGDADPSAEQGGDARFGAPGERRREASGRGDVVPHRPEEITDE